jgi:hypothetical protein
MGLSYIEYMRERSLDGSSKAIAFLQNTLWSISIMIRFEILDPRLSELTKTLGLIQQWKAEGYKVIGFEVTVPQQAELLDQNFDPQHSGGDLTKSCIKQVEEVSGSVLSGEDYIFCTNRADLDSVGSMAIYSQHEYQIEDFQEIYAPRVNLIHEADIFAKGEWSPRPLFTQGYEQNELGAIARAVADFKVPLAKRVQWMKHWLHCGAEPEGYRAQYEKERSQIESAFASGETTVKSDGALAIVVSRLRAATLIGYSKAPVVIAYNPEMPSKNGPYKKFTICQYNVGYCDLEAVLNELNGLEGGWGGSPTIIGSPQEEDTQISIEIVEKTVRKHLTYCG